MANFYLESEFGFQIYTYLIYVILRKFLIYGEYTRKTHFIKIDKAEIEKNILKFKPFSLKAL